MVKIERKAQLCAPVSISLALAWCTCSVVADSACTGVLAGINLNNVLSEYLIDLAIMNAGQQKVLKCKLRQEVKNSRYNHVSTSTDDFMITGDTVTGTT